MGEVEVLHPQNLWKDRFSHRHHRHSKVQSPMKFDKKPNISSNHNPNYYPAKSNRRKRNPQNTSHNRYTSTVPPNNHNLVMGQVKILKRGEVLTDVLTTSNTDPDFENKKVADLNDLLVISSMDRMGPEPEMIPNQIRILNCYAGSAFISSPPPSSLPQPVFFKKKNVDINNDDATSDLRRLLRLDLDGV